MAQADPAPRTRTRTAAADTAGNGKSPARSPAQRRPDRRTAPRAQPPDPRDARPPRPQLLGARAGHPPGRRPRRARGVPEQQDPGLRGRAGRHAADARGPRLLASAGAAGSSRGSARGPGSGTSSEHIALEFQNLAGTDVRHGKTRGTGEYGRYNVIFEYREEQVGIEAGKAAVGLVNHLVAPSDPAVAFDLMAELEKLIRLAERLAFGPSTQALLDEAAGRDIPYIRLDRFSLVQLGQGVHQQRIRATMTSRTSGIAVDIASDKKLTNRLLDSAGLPVPRSEVVETEDEAVAAAKRIGYPCVLKPLDGNHGRGVALNLRTEDEVRAAFAVALRQSRSGDVVVESYITGNDYRVLVIGGKLAAVAERVPASVTGDGEHTIRQLVEATNADPRRGIGHEKVLTKIKLDDNAEERPGGPGLHRRQRPRGGRVREARPHRQHVDRRHLDRPDDGGPPRQHRDRRDRGARRRPRHRRHRLHLPRHRDPGPRDRRRHRRGQRGARVPDAHPPDRGRAAVRRQARHRPAVPARHARAHPDPRRHRHQRQDDDGPDDRPHPQADGPAGGHDLDRRHRDRRPADEARRHVGPEVGADGAPEPDRRHGGVRGRPRRDPARGPGLRPQRRRGRDQRHRRPPGPRRHRHAGPAGQREGRARRVRAAIGRRGPQRRRLARVPDGPPLRRPGRAVLDGEGEGRGRLRPRRRAHVARQRGVLPRGHAPGRADRAQARAAQDAGPVHAPDPGDVRRPGADERGQRAGRGGRGVGVRRAPPRHPPGPADVHDVVLPGARAAQPASRSRARAWSSTTATTSTACASCPTS